jgi:hypothetical protein
MNTKKTQLLYDSLGTISRSFDQILQELQRLQQLDCFRGRAPIKSVDLAVRETRAWTLSEILDVLHQREECQWMRLGRLRRTHEKRLDDVQAKPIRRKRQTARRV